MKANIYHFEYMSSEGQIKEVSGHKVNVPFIQAFAVKNWKYWHVYELKTGLLITGAPATTMKDAVRLASEKLQGIGEEETLKAVASRPVINP